MVDKDVMANRWDRLRTLKIPNGEVIVDVDLAQIESGHAWAYRDYLKGLPAGKAGRYVAAEKTPKRPNKDSGPIRIRSHPGSGEKISAATAVRR